MTFKAKVFGIQFDTPNLNGRIYVREDIEKSISKQSQFFVAFESYTPAVSVSEICGYAKPSMEPDGLWVEVSMLNTPKANDIKTVLENYPDKLCITPVGVGLVEDGVVRDFALSHFTFSDASKCK